MTALITLSMAVYSQPKMLDVWFNTLRTYNPAVLERMELLMSQAVIAQNRPLAARA